MLSVTSLALVLALGAPVLLASPATAAATAPRTMALEFADGLGRGQNVAHAEDRIPMRSVENLEILSDEFRLGYGAVALPVTVTDITDGNGDGLDDNGKVGVRLFGSDACLTLTSSTYSTSAGTCQATTASTRGVATRSARGVDAHRRWRAASENAYAASGFGDRVSPWNIDVISASRTELRAGVRMTGLVDRNFDNADDDGKLTFTSSGGTAVCLTLTKDTRVAAAITAGAC